MRAGRDIFGQRSNVRSHWSIVVWSIATVGSSPYLLWCCNAQSTSRQSSCSVFTLTKSEVRFSYISLISGPVKTRTHCWRDDGFSHVNTRAKFVPDEPTHILCSGHKICFWKAETLFVSSRRAAVLPRFATDGQNQRAPCCRHTVPLCFQGITAVQ